MLANILGFLAIVLLGAGLWAILSALLVGFLLLALTALEGERPAEQEALDESIERLLREIEASKRMIDALDDEIESISRVGSSEAVHSFR